jgi:hypothetical protein
MVHDHVPLLVKHLDTIGRGEVRAAYLYLTHHAAALQDFDCRPQDKGEVRDFRYYTAGEQPFAFIVNQGSLLWYFRAPGLRHPAASLALLQQRFAEVNENPAGEITVRVSNLADAKRIAALVFDSSED